MGMTRSMLTIAAVVITATAAAAAGIGGSWAFAFRAEWAPPQLACTLQVDGAALTGSCGSRGRSVSNAARQADGTQVEWTLSVPTGPSGAVMTYGFNGTLDAQSDTISGTLTVTDPSGTTAPRDTPFTAHRE